MTPEEQAKALLPCENVCDEGQGHEHSIICPAYYRPAVAAALAENHHIAKIEGLRMAQGIIVYRMDPLAEIDAEIAKLKKGQ